MEPFAFVVAQGLPTMKGVNTRREESAVLLNGVAVDDRLVLQLAGLVDPMLGTRLITAYRLRARVVPLTSGEQQAILTALEVEPAASLREARDAFLNSDAWRLSESLQ